ncbi:succinylglutamate desuccinylase/aspartoacylase domain-containing protein [Facilibium subflavum]|uniref:succinylglutamate desuccinylase/aspartoacylase domain-containing protein n=1 Tax=Facilibium subflavum TaxID=2219058 RepID=UPI000E65C68A|nr:succinylglutamate desuccinylase/aspartoacylase family protein [Facilibium subflavum]
MLDINTKYDTSIKVNHITRNSNKEIGWLDIPNPSNRSAWGVMRVPYAVIGNTKGPTVLLSAGLHGDEYEGQIALNNLIHTINPNEVTGRIIVLPSVNIEGAYNATRLTPIANQDMNRIFPGKADGTPAERLAHFMTYQLIAQADCVIDIHSGGYSLDFLPCGVIHDSSDHAIKKQRIEALKAFNAPYNLILEELDATGMIDTLVESQGKLFLSTEIGGGQRVTQQSVQVASKGIINTLRHLHILQDKPAEPGDKPLYQLPESGFCIAPEEGIFEPFYDLGSQVKKGNVIGQIHRLHAPNATPVQVHAHCDGLVFGKRSPAITHLGDTLLLIAQTY